MKKTVLGLVALAGVAGGALAQSSVTIFGTVDMSAKYVKNDGSARRVSLSQDSLNGTRLGFRGVEDLGGGLNAGFWLEAGVNPDTGTVNAKFFNRRSTLSLSGGFGELRLGHDYTPNFLVQTLFDAFGATTGMGSSLNVAQLYGGTRLDNSIGYFLPSNLGGVYGQAMVAASEGGTTADRGGRYVGGRVGYAKGPFDVAFAAGSQRLDALGLTQKTYDLGASYDFGVAKLLGYIDRDTRPSLAETRLNLSAVVPLGAGEFHVGYERSRFTNDLAAFTNTISQGSLAYVYNLSKRTALYGTLSRLSNGDNSNNSVVFVRDTSQSAPPVPGGKSNGAEIGLRHFF
jgi:predicted porin